MSQADSFRVAVDTNPPCVSLETTVAEVVFRMNQGSPPRLGECSVLEEKLTQRHYTYVLVIADGKLHGILTERDIVRITVRNLDLEATQVAQVMSHPVKSLLFSNLESPFAAIDFLRIHRIRHLPLIDNQGNLMGVITPQSIRETMNSTDLLRLRTVGESMSRQVVSLPCDANIIAAVNLMLANQVSCVVITANQEPSQGETSQGGNRYPIGIITERDIVKCQGQKLDFNETEVQSVMSTPLVCISPSDSLWNADQIMKDLGVRRLVVGQDNKLAGIITQSGILSTLNPVEMYSMIQLLQQQVESLKDEKLHVIQSQATQLEQKLQEKEEDFQWRLNRDRLIAKLSSRFINSRFAEIDTCIQEALQELAEFTNFDNSHLFVIFEKYHTSRVVYEWCNSEFMPIRPGLINIRFSEFSGWTQTLRGGNTFCIPSFQSLSPEARADCTYWQNLGVKSLICVPLSYQNQWMGWIGFTSLSKARDCSEVGTVQSDSVDTCSCLFNYAELLKLVGEVFTNALVRKQRDEELQQHQHNLKALVDLRTKQWHESAQRYQHLYENTPVMLHSVNTQGELVSVSNMWLENLGYERHEVLGRKSIEFFTEESQQVVQQALPEYFQTGVCVDVPYQMVCKNGKVIDVLLSAILQRDESGQIIRSLTVIIDVTERNIAEKARQESEQRFRLMADAAPVLIWSSRADRFCDYLSKGWLDFTGRTLEQEIGNGWTEGVHPDDLKHCLDTYITAFDLRKDFSTEYRLRRFDGEYRWVFGRGTPRFLPNGEFCGYIGSCIDITQQKNLEQALFQELSQEKELAQITLNSIGDGVITTNRQKKVVYFNPIAKQLTGWNETQAKGRPLSAIFHIINEMTGKSIENPVEYLFRDRFTSIPNTLLISRDGSQYCIEGSAAPIRDEQGSILGFVLVFRDVTQKRSLTSQLSWQANHDRLTGLVNRYYFEKKVVDALESAQVENKRHILCFLDLDQFKVVNDTCGHRAGDELLRQISRVIQQQIRSADTLARIGGDEFAIMLYQCTLKQAKAIAEKIRQAIEDFRFIWEDKSFGIGSSIGIVQIDCNSFNLESILSAADVACYAAKYKGRNRIQVYKADDIELAKQRQQRQWTLEIRQALETNRLRLYIQPIVSTFDTENRNIHFEVLLRMVDKFDEVVSPGSFIPAAERYDLMSLLDRWVIENSFLRLEREFSCHKYSDAQNLQNSIYAINLSGASLNDDYFLDFLTQRLACFQFSPEIICFEITETVAISDLNKVSIFMGKLKELGCKFALDDFGAGMSSFSYLKTLPLDFLKIDGKFIRDILQDPTIYAIVESINHVGHVMGLQIIAENIENTQIIHKLQSIGVDYLQGFAVAEPEPWV